MGKEDGRSSQGGGGDRETNINEKMSDRGGRGRPGRPHPIKGPKDKKVKKQLYWFAVTEGSFDLCSNITNNTDSLEIMEGPPQKTCQENNQTICLCGKKGEGSNITNEELMEQKGRWKYLCGQCRKRTPYSFKIDRKSLALGGKGKKRPAGSKEKQKSKNGTVSILPIGKGKKRPAGNKETDESRDSDGWLRTKAGEYKFLKKGKCELACTREEGKAECEKQGGYLAEINNKEEAKALKEILGKNVNNAQVWIGGIFTGEGKQGWQWEGGKEEISFNNWGKNQGDGSNKRECMAVDGEGKWWGIHCNLRVSLGRLTPLCEKTK